MAHFKLSSVLQLLFLVCLFIGCEEGDFLEEPSSEGINEHSFVLEGEKFVRQPNTIDFGSQIYLIDGQIDYLNFMLLSEIQGEDINYPEANLIVRTYGIPEAQDLPKEYALQSYSNAYTYVDGHYSYEQVDSSVCYTKIYYTETSSSCFEVYNDIVSGSICITRYDSICSGTFTFEVANGIDTLTISEGVFDYEIL